MKGEVLHYDDNAGTGQISGADGIRYNFTRGDLKQLVPISKGSKVDFDFEGKAAKDIYLDGATAAAPAMAAAPAAAAAPAYTGPIESDLGLWGYFIRAYTAKYSSFKGRARRKEYWSVALFVFIVYAITYGIASAGFAQIGGVTSYQEMFAAMGQSPLILTGLGLTMLFGLISILPLLGLLTRRVHDIGQSGWIAVVLVVVSLIPYVNFIGGIGILVVALIKGQLTENKYGPPVTPAA